MGCHFWQWAVRTLRWQQCHQWKHANNKNVRHKQTLRCYQHPDNPCSLAGRRVREERPACSAVSWTCRRRLPASAHRGSWFCWTHQPPRALPRSLPPFHVLHTISWSTAPSLCWTSVWGLEVSRNGFYTVRPPQATGWLFRLDPMFPKEASERHSGARPWQQPAASCTPPRWHCTCPPAQQTTGGTLTIHGWPTTPEHLHQFDGWGPCYFGGTSSPPSRQSWDLARNVPSTPWPCRSMRRSSRPARSPAASRLTLCGVPRPPGSAIPSQWHPWSPEHGCKCSPTARNLRRLYPQAHAAVSAAGLKCTHI